MNKIANCNILGIGNHNTNFVKHITCLFLLVCSFNINYLYQKSVDFSSIKFTVQVAEETHVVSTIEDLALHVPHENDIVSLECPNDAPGNICTYK